MVTSLTTEMTEASNEHAAYVAMIRQAVAAILDFEQHHNTAAETDERMDQAIDQLMGGIPKVRVADIAPAIKEFVQNTVSNNLRIDVLNSLEDKTAPLGANINETFIAHLAMASIYGEEDASKIREHNALAYYLLGQGQNDKIAAIVETLEYAKNYAFGFTAQQQADIHQIIAVKTKDYMTADKKDPAIGERLAKLVQEAETDEAISQLAGLTQQTVPSAGSSLDLK